MAKRRSRTTRWEDMAEPMKRQALNDYELACRLQEVISRDVHYACTGVALLAQTAEKLIKAWLLSRKERSVLWTVKWTEHDILATLDDGGPLSRRRSWLRQKLVGDTFETLERLLELVPKKSLDRKNVEYPYYAGVQPTAPCDGIRDYEYYAYRLAVAKLVRLLDPFTD
jgi:hypothetical protein